jgi:hypothetical protein
MPVQRVLPFFVACPGTEAGVLDEILAHLVPALLGNRTRMLESRERLQELALKLCRQPATAVDLWSGCENHNWYAPGFMTARVI